jgi:uncharacterized protein (UPF0303 family)
MNILSDAPGALKYLPSEIVIDILIKTKFITVKVWKRISMSLYEFVCNHTKHDNPVIDKKFLTNIEPYVISGGNYYISTPYFSAVVSGTIYKKTDNILRTRI